MRAHLIEIDDFCGFVHFSSQLIIPVRCPFCLGLGVVQEFAEPKLMREHVREVHLDKLRLPTGCPHPLCKNKTQFNEVSKLLEHFSVQHGIANAEEMEIGKVCEPKTPPSKRKQMELSAARRKRYKERTSSSQV